MPGWWGPGAGQAPGASPVGAEPGGGRALRLFAVDRLCSLLHSKPVSFLYLGSRLVMQIGATIFKLPALGHFLKYKYLITVSTEQDAREPTTSTRAPDCLRDTNGPLPGKAAGGLCPLSPQRAGSRHLPRRQRWGSVLLPPGAPQRAWKVGLKGKEAFRGLSEEGRVCAQGSGSYSPAPSCLFFHPRLLPWLQSPQCQLRLPSKTGEGLPRDTRCHGEGGTRGTCGEALPPSPSPASARPWLTGQKKRVPECALGTAVTRARVAVDSRNSGPAVALSVLLQLNFFLHVGFPICEMELIALGTPLQGTNYRLQETWRSLDGI